VNNNAILSKFEAYLLTEKRVSQNTFDAYKRDISQFIEFLNKRKIILKKVQLKELKKFLEHLHKQAISARSIARKISSLKTFFAYLHRQFEWENVAKDLRIPKMEKKLPRYLSEKDITTLFKMAGKDKTHNGVRNRVMLCLMYSAGLRVSELTNLEKSDVQFDTGFVTISGKGGKQRQVPIPHAMLAMLKEYINITLATFSRKKNQTVPYLFPIAYGGKIKPITRQAFWNILKKMCKKAGIDNAVSPHQLRHSLATHLLKQGADLRSLQLLLGHENLSTVQIYTHVEKSHLRKVYDKKHPRS